jgi:glutamate-5-semialdehyde dehydrogenase
MRPTREENPPSSIAEQSAAAKRAARVVGTLPTSKKNAVLNALADSLVHPENAERVLAANRTDMEGARAAGLAAPKLARLELTTKSLVQLAEGLRQVAALPDPVGRVTLDRPASGPGAAPSGLHIRKVRAPLGVIAMIYEARPGVTIDAMALCFKAGNACILRGGKEAQHSNAALTHLAHAALAAHGVPEDALVNLSGTSREQLAELLTLDQCIDLVIPRGGRELIEMVCRTSRIPTVQHYQGVCHIYVDEAADVDKAVDICATAKTSAPSTCNALECVLVHRNIADRFVPKMLTTYRDLGVEVRGTPMIAALGDVAVAKPDDFGREFLDLIVAMRTVDSLDEAIDHIATYGSSHTDAILTRDTGPGGTADRFVAAVASSCVLVNASTRFNDGFQLGLGAEIGISTSRVHAYGVMGLEELTTQRWIAIGTGQTR